MDIRKFIFVKTNLESENGYVSKDSIGIVKDVIDGFYIIEFLNCILKVNKNLVEEFDPLKTGDGFEFKVCNVCHRLLPTIYFDKNQNGKNNRTIRRPSCKDCRAVIDGKNMTTDEKRKFENIKPHFVFWECPICHKKTIPSLTSKVVLDHDHLTGKGRSWICDSCNTGIGRFKDDIKLLKEAQIYLLKFLNKN